MSTQRAQFTTRLGVIATTVGSAVGLGNIWRFPYEAGVHGGGAFMLIYILFILLIGIPVITAEFIIGRRSRSNVYGAFKRLPGSRMWRAIGLVGILSSLMILSFYSVVAGWTADYVVSSLQNFDGAMDRDTLHARFGAFIGSWDGVLWTIGFLLINYLILSRGVQKGIERMANIMMPLLFIILIIFCINSLMLPGASEGLSYLFHPDFSRLTPSVWMGAMGQAFFSLSLGLGCLITYSSYFNVRTRLLNSACTIAGLDTLVAILAGIIIFPAVFTYGESPTAGPTLVFEVLPSIFLNMEMGMFWSTFFFILLFLASLTSTVSMSEISIAFFIEECHMSRRRATILTTSIAMVFGTLCSLSFGPLADLRICGRTMFDLFDFGSSNVLLPIGGILISLYAGWALKRRILTEELRGVRRGVISLLIICMRYIAPAGISLVFLSGLGVI